MPVVLHHPAPDDMQEFIILYSKTLIVGDMSFKLLVVKLPGPCALLSLREAIMELTSSAFVGLKKLNYY